MISSKHYDFLEMTILGLASIIPLIIGIFVVISIIQQILSNVPVEIVTWTYFISNMVMLVSVVWNTLESARIILSSPIQPGRKITPGSRTKDLKLLWVIIFALEFFSIPLMMVWGVGFLFIAIIFYFARLWTERIVNQKYAVGISSQKDYAFEERI